MQPTAIDSKSKHTHGERVAFIQAEHPELDYGTAPMPVASTSTLPAAIAAGSGITPVIAIARNDAWAVGAGSLQAASLPHSIAESERD